MPKNFILMRLLFSDMMLMRLEIDIFCRNEDSPEYFHCNTGGCGHDAMLVLNANDSYGN